VNAKVSDKKYKIKFDIFSKDNSGNSQEVKMVVRILKVEESKYCVEFTKLGGDNYRFLEHFGTFKNKVLNSLNDTSLE